MKAGRELDATIALKIMGIKAIEPDQVPRYSTDIFVAYNIIKKLQQLGWLCNVGSRIGSDGELFYRARFFQHGRECERFSNTIPMAICSSALAVIQDEYFEYVDVLKEVDDDTPIDIIPGSSTGFAKIEADDDIAATIQKAIRGNDLSEQNWLTLTKNMIESLRKNGYIIIKKPE